MFLLSWCHVFSCRFQIWLNKTKYSFWNYDPIETLLLILIFFYLWTHHQRSAWGFETGLCKPKEDVHLRVCMWGEHWCDAGETALIRKCYARTAVVFSCLCYRWKQHPYRTQGQLYQFNLMYLALNHNNCCLQMLYYASYLVSESTQCFIIINMSKFIICGQTFSFLWMKIYLRS